MNALRDLSEKPFAPSLTIRDEHEPRGWIGFLKKAPLHRDGSIGHEQLWPVVFHAIHE